MKTPLCKLCGGNHYKTFCFKARKPIKQKGKRTVKYEAFRDNVVRPYLDKTYGHRCVECGATNNLDVQHKQKRGSHPELKMELSNLEYLCRSCHIKAT